MTEELTRRQREALDIITAHIEKRGYPPTVRELAEMLGISGPKGAKKFLDILEKKGYIERRPESSRAVRVIAGGTAGGIPVVGRVAAGTPITAIENLEGYLSVKGLRDGRDGERFLLRVTGESMIGAHIAPGDMVLVKSQGSAENGDIVVAMLNDEATIKRYRSGPGGVSLVPEHPEMSPIAIDGGDSFFIVGKVVGVIRDLEGGLVIPE
jgi:repressor LexA